MVLDSFPLSNGFHRRSGFRDPFSEAPSLVPISAVPLDSHSSQLVVLFGLDAHTIAIPADLETLRTAASRFRRS